MMKISDRAVLLRGITEELDPTEMVSFFEQYVPLKSATVLDNNVGLLVVNHPDDRSTLLAKVQGKQYNQAGDVVDLSLLTYSDTLMVYRYNADHGEIDGGDEKDADAQEKVQVKRATGQQREGSTDEFIHGVLDAFVHLDRESKDRVLEALTPQTKGNITKKFGSLGKGRLHQSPIPRPPISGRLNFDDEEIRTSSERKQKPVRKTMVNNVDVKPQLWVPKVTQFSGDQGKGEATFQQWKYEVKALLHDQSIPLSTVMQGVRRSLKGSALEVLHNMGELTSPEPLIAKLEIIFGNVFTTEQLLSKFFGAVQLKDESIAVWACRLEEIAARANEKEPGIASASMKRSKFWTGLTCDVIKTATRHKFDAGFSFEELLIACRVAEAEMELTKMRGSEVAQPKDQRSEVKADMQVNSIQQELRQNNNTLQSLVDMVKVLHTRIDTLEKERPEPVTAATAPTYQAPQPHLQQPPQRASDPTSRPPTWRQQNTQPIQQPQQYSPNPRTDTQYPAQTSTERQPPSRVCHNCGDPNHFWRSCPHPARHFNLNRV